jgi:hypothetical protein
MRLEPGEIEAIRRAAQEVFAGARVRVFGSRVLDHLKGGDLDLWLEVAPGAATLANELRFRALIARPARGSGLHRAGDPGGRGPARAVAPRSGGVHGVPGRNSSASAFRQLVMIRNRT